MFIIRLKYKGVFFVNKFDLQFIVIDSSFYLLSLALNKRRLIISNQELKYQNFYLHR